MNEREEGKFIGEENRKRMNELARQALESNGLKYLNQVGEPHMRNEMQDFRKTLAQWNTVSSSSIRFTTDTIALMINTLTVFPILIQKFELMSDPKFMELNMKLCAMRYLMIKDRNDLIQKSNPDLSTPPK